MVNLSYLQFTSLEMDLLASKVAKAAAFKPLKSKIRRSFSQLSFESVSISTQHNSKATRAL
jgi:hypothetical protein